MNWEKKFSDDMDMLSLRLSFCAFTCGMLKTAENSIITDEEIIASMHEMAAAYQKRKSELL